MKTSLAEIPIEDCVMLKRNPQYLTRRQMNALKQSIKRDGFVVPILVNQRNGKYEIISGNHRFLAAKELKLRTISAVVGKLTDRQAKRLSVNLNTVHGELSPSQLAPFLADFDTKTLDEIHLDDALTRDLIDFDRDLAKQLESLSVPKTIANKPQSPQGTCKCPKCGKVHMIADVQKTSRSNTRKKPN